MTTKELADLLHGAPRRIHLIGVAGSGMSGIAGLCLALKHRVSGSEGGEGGQSQSAADSRLTFP